MPLRGSIASCREGNTHCQAHWIPAVGILFSTACGNQTPGRFARRSSSNKTRTRSRCSNRGRRKLSGRTLTRSLPPLPCRTITTPCSNCRSWIRSRKSSIRRRPAPYINWAMSRWTSVSCANSAWHSRGLRTMGIRLSARPGRYPEKSPRSRPMVSRTRKTRGFAHEKDQGVQGLTLGAGRDLVRHRQVFQVAADVIAAGLFDGLVPQPKRETPGPATIRLLGPPLQLTRPEGGHHALFPRRPAQIAPFDLDGLPCLHRWRGRRGSDGVNLGLGLVGGSLEEPAQGRASLVGRLPLLVKTLQVGHRAFHRGALTRCLEMLEIGKDLALVSAHLRGLVGFIPQHLPPAGKRDRGRRVDLLCLV